MAINLSSRGTGTIDSTGKVTLTKIFSYDIVSELPFDTNMEEFLRREEIKRIRAERRAKLNKIFKDEKSST